MVTSTGPKLESEASSRRRIVGCALAGLAVGSYATVAIPALIPAMERGGSQTAGSLGGLMGLQIIGSMVGGLAGGWISDRRDRTRSFGVALLIASVGYALGSVSGGSVGVLRVSLMVLGLGSGAAFVVGGGLLSALFPMRRRGSFSILMVTSAVAGIGYPYVISWLQALWESGRLSYASLIGLPFGSVAAALAVLGVALLTMPVTYPPRPPEHGSIHASAGRLGLVMVLALATLHGSADAVLYQWITRYLTVSFPEPPFPPAWVLSLYSAAYLTVRLGLSLLPDRFGRRGLFIVPGLLAGPLVFLALRAPGFTGTVTLYVLATCLYGIEFPALMGYAAQRYPDRFSTLFGVVSALNIVSAGAVWGVGLWIESTGDMSSALSVSAAGFFAFGLLAAVWTVGERRRVVETTPPGRVQVL
jgi:MFS family permease